MIDVLILFLVFYFALYRRMSKKYGDDPSKSIWIRLFKRYEGTAFDSLFKDNQKNQVPIVKCIFAASVVQLTLFFSVNFYVADMWREKLDYRFIKEEERFLYNGTKMFCVLCTPVVVPALLYTVERRKDNPEEMFVYKYKQIKKSCVESGFKNRDCHELFKMIESTGDVKVLGRIARVLVNSFESKYDFCQVAGSASRYFYRHREWKDFISFGEKTCKHTEEDRCDFLCDSFKRHKYKGKEQMAEDFEWRKNLREARGEELDSYNWNIYPIPRDFDFEIKEVDGYLKNEM